jgi:hypothetical protein
MTLMEHINIDDRELQHASLKKLRIANSAKWVRHQPGKLGMSVYLALKVMAWDQIETP